MTKKILSVLLAVLMACSVISVAASAADTQDKNVVYDELMDNDVYYHLAYVKEQNFFANKIDLYTALGLYDNAWDNLFTGDVDINYAKTILLAVIEKVDVDYQNETFEKFVKVLEGASSIADLINKVNKYTGVLDFAESNEWATSIEVLNDVIKVANYGNAMYEKFIDGYASILSARAADVYYGKFLNRIIDNCKSKAVVDAAKEIKADIDGELKEAVQHLVDELLQDAAGDAAEMGIDVAMSSNTVTAVIKKVYKTGGNLANKLFKTETMYGYMCSLAEIYYIEDCITPWAVYNVETRANDEMLADFSVNAMFVLREMGETLLSETAQTSDTTIKALFKGYNVDALKVRTAATLAKLTVLRQLVDMGVEAVALFTVVGESKALVKLNGAYGAYLPDGAASDLIEEQGVFAQSVYNEAIDSYVKVFAICDTAQLVDVTAYDMAAAVVNVYMQLDSKATGALVQSFATVPSSAQLSVTAQNILCGENPTLYIKKGDNRYTTGQFTDSFSVTGEKLEFSFISGAGSSTASTDAEDAGFSLVRFFHKIVDFFKKLFKVVK